MNSVVIPPSAFSLNLDPFEFRLYAEIIRIAAGSFRCIAGTRKLASQCSISVGAVSKAKQSLVEKGLITILPGNQLVSQPDTIFIVE